MKTVFFISIFIYAKILFAGYADSISLNKQIMLTLTNIVRTSPEQFRDIYTDYQDILLPENYSPVSPLFFSEQLSQSSQYHSDDMANNIGLSHTSSDGTSFSDRVKSFYSESGWIGENIATGHSDELTTLLQWIGDEISTNTPATDLSGNDGHRKNIMNSKYNEIGIGYSYNSNQKWYHFWCQDFGGGTADYNTIPSACAIERNSGDSIEFLLTYYDKNNKAPQEIYVNFNNEKYPLYHYLGNSYMGTYRIKIKLQSSNYSYKFFAKKDDGSIVTYPETTTITNGRSTVKIESKNKFDKNFYIFPNPTINNSSIYISNKYNNSLLRIYNNQGNITINKIISITNNGYLKIDLSNLSKGLYYAIIYDRNNKILSKITFYKTDN